MRFRCLFLLAGWLTIVAWLAAPVRAEVMASGTRMAVAGAPPRFYMTYGHIEEPELFAPITQELGRLQIAFQQRGDEMLVFHRGRKIAEWSIVRAREDVPETREHPCVLILGGAVYVPVRALAELAPLDVRWDARARLVTLAPAAARRSPAVAEGERPEPADGGDLVLLTDVRIVPGAEGVEIAVRSTEPVRPSWLNLQNPPRIALDFPNARWADGLQPPAGAGPVAQIRLGRFTPTTARLVLDLSGAARVTAVSVLPQEVQLSVGPGREARIARIAPEAEAKIRAAIRRRATGARMLASRDGSLLDDPIVSPVPPRSELPIEPAPRAGSLAGRTICVDAGHGGRSAGARGLFYLEKDLCLKMALELKRALEARGARVVMTRDSDVYVDLYERCRIANESGADVFVSIHCNSTPRRNSASGSQTYWRNPQSLRLARTLHPYLLQAVGLRDGGIRNDNFCVIRETRMPSVLLEIAYINHARDEQLLARPDFHASLGEHLAQGLVRYFSEGE